MSSRSAVRPFEVRHLQIARAAIAALAAAMITFSSDHSATLGLSVFSGFAITSAFVLFVAAWLVFPAGRRSAAVLLAVLDLAAGMVAGIGPIRSDGLFFGLVIGWGLATGVAEGVAGLRARRAAALGDDPSSAPRRGTPSPSARSACSSVSACSWSRPVMR
ncbi:hypothetical protein [Microbacterium elymi]|uniref:Uncharacterized protein n=1 Tax=Microbacterium elymi TaxID=2909587 RepID=A0ABY5NGI5_9MICO|nr:hypothetical protein [Microbacterium elymi]UUT34272.1 hypothetical protein L2X98_26690 [Microbacterium elymi]